ncbi:hypothetical protein EYF80_022631 [Liparis tanakae]|uniref:Uncharacterized protein n=1 Tax=Liparis tanakae TaxID=230148 RepID=A0A4Z2HNH4_9TELE|nr:hypothetical protein EYF80_022631 [Liparis tanakae]
MKVTPTKTSQADCDPIGRLPLVVRCGPSAQEDILVFRAAPLPPPAKEAGDGDDGLDGSVWGGREDPAGPLRADDRWEHGVLERMFSSSSVLPNQQVVFKLR